MPTIKSVIQDCTKAVQKYSFMHAYHQAFELVHADTLELKNRAYRLRYQVFCEEYDYHEPYELGGYFEKDLYDEHAEHYLLIHRQSNETVGTLRVVLPTKKNLNLPIAHQCSHPLLRMPEHTSNLCEISRFCMAPRFRRRPGDGRFLSSYHDQDNIKVKGKKIRRIIPYPQAALLRGAFEAAMRARILNCVMLVEPRHLASLKRIGLSYRILGPHVGHYGGAQPMIFNIKHALDIMREKDPYCYEIVSDNGRLQAIADLLSHEGWQDSLIDPSCHEMILEACAGQSINTES